MARVRREVWQERIERWRDSGLTAREFAAQIGVKTGTLTAWKYKLAAMSRQAATTSAGGARLEFVEVTGAVSASTVATGGERLEVVCGGGRTIRVPKDFDGGTLVRLLDVLEGR